MLLMFSKCQYVVVVNVQQCSLLHENAVPAQRHVLTDIIGYDRQELRRDGRN